MSKSNLELSDAVVVNASKVSRVQTYINFSYSLFNGNWAFPQKHLGPIKPIDRCCISTLFSNNWVVYGLSVRYLPLLNMLGTVLLISSIAFILFKQDVAVTGFVTKVFQKPKQSVPSGVKSNCDFLTLVTISKLNRKIYKLQC